MRWIIFIIFYLVLNIYSYHAIRTVTKSPWILAGYIILSAFILVYFIYQWTQPNPDGGFTGGRGYALGFLLALLAANFIIAIFLLGEDVIRVLVAAYEKVTTPADSFSIPSRRKFISQLALGVAAIPFASLLYGMYQGKYNFKVLKYTLHFDDLPASFDGYKITQISDIHSGSFDNRKKIEYAIDLINEQGSDTVLFTGDLVNNRASEMTPWIETFGRIQASDGVFSVLGNHDYGDYVSWENDRERLANLRAVKDVHSKMGWNLLLNEHRFIQKNGERIAMVGVENWGIGGFKKAGDLNKASAGLTAKDFKVLLSHDPSHWQEQVKADPTHFQLTLSGHTHGMQFGIEIPGWFRWSPVQYRYENWAGIYEEFGRYINVNRGFGFLAYPGRVGIWPEISVIELKKGPRPS